MYGGVRRDACSIVRMEAGTNSMAEHNGSRPESYKTFTVKMSRGNSVGNSSCPMEVFTGLTPSTLLLRHVVMRTYRTLHAINDERSQFIVDVEKLQVSLEANNKDVSSRSEQGHANTQRENERIADEHRYWRLRHGQSECNTSARV